MTSQDYIALIDSYGGHFSLREFHIQDGIERMDTSFLRSYLAWRKWHGFSTLISSTWRKDDPNAHGKGMAIDNLLFTQWREAQPTAMHHWLLASTWPFKGVGLYFDWNYLDRSRNRDIPAIGLHVDGWDGDRPGQRPLRWLRIDGNYYYQSVTYGSFYCQANGQTTSLQKAINQHSGQ
ncbi:MAG: hypothetical protein WD529_07230 [Balneolaceae bacterium]